MKTLISILSLAICSLLFQGNLFAQAGDNDYVIVEYMKVKPGMADKYLACEEAWKAVHQYRLKQGLITGWELEEVLFPSGTDAEYDYLTITHFKNWKSIDTGGSWYEAAMKTLPASTRDIAENAEMYRDIVKREIWMGGDRAFAPGTTQPKFRVENFMKIPVDGWEKWIELETKFIKPVHEKNIALGNRAG